jgi:hypothetical protein
MCNPRHSEYGIMRFIVEFSAATLISKFKTNLADQRIEILTPQAPLILIP